VGVDDGFFGAFGTVRAAYMNSDFQWETQAFVLATPRIIEGKAFATPPTFGV
jgi:hypothetical protein